MDAELAQVERYERAVVARTHPEGPAGVQHEDRRTIRPDPTEDLDLGHLAAGKVCRSRSSSTFWVRLTSTSVQSSAEQGPTTNAADRSFDTPPTAAGSSAAGDPAATEQGFRHHPGRGR